jgi:proteasome lid subunit RPN8/RPN11
MVEKESNQKNKVFIKKEAFRNMLTHVLRFGNDALEKSQEVLGICLGKYNTVNDKIIIENAVPIIHGDKVEIGFDKDMYDLFNEIEQKYSSDLIGYYHSHPSWGLYLSDSDLKNIQYFQNEKFPNGISIVFDHTLVGKNGGLGFEIFRLEDFLKTDKYHTVPFDIELPNSLEYFKWIQKFSEDFQKKNPILIKEINEFIEPITGDLQEIPLTEDIPSDAEKIVEYPELTSLVSGFQNGAEKLSEMFADITKTQIHDWIRDMNQGASKGTEYISQAVTKMKEAISSGIKKVDSWFNKTLNEAVNEFKSSVSTYVDTRVESNKELTEVITKTKDNLLTNLNTQFEDSISNITKEMKTSFSSLSEKVDQGAQTTSHVKEKLETLKSNITETNNLVNSYVKDLEKKIENSITPLQTNLNEKVEKLNSELQPLKEFNSEIKNLLEKLQKIITGFRNLI